MNRRTFVSHLVAQGSFLAVLPVVTKGEIACSAVSPTVAACTAGLATDIASVSMNRPQQETNWCWAACIQMVFRYHGLKISQAKIVQGVFGGSVNQPGSPQDILDALNRTWTDDDDDDYDVEGDVYSVSPATVAEDLADDLPVIIGSLGHAMVLTAISYYRDLYGNGQIVGAVVRDPWPGRGRRQITPVEWANLSFAARVRVSPG